MASNRKKEKNLVKRARQRREKTLAEKASQDAEALQKALRLDAGASPSEKDSLNIDYTITRDPLPDPWFDSLPTEDREDLEHAHEIITSNRRKAVALFEKLAAKYPDNPSIYNNLMAARGTANAGALTEAIERFPDYLFAKTNFAHYLLREKRATEVPAVFGVA